MGRAPERPRRSKGLVRGLEVKTRSSNEIFDDAWWEMGHGVGVNGNSFLVVHVSRHVVL